MNIVGIISEYNPFHLGHKHHVEATRAMLGSDCAVVCVMSGNFVQRGEPALCSKNARAEAAVLSGADLVIELPLPWALSSAEGFARGAVGLLGDTGVVSHISFGSECGSVEPLENAARQLLHPELDKIIREYLATGVSYARARQAAVEKLCGGPMPVFESPNNILGIEYIKALYQQYLPIQPITVPRAGDGHDSDAGGDMPSASYLRALLSRDEDIRPFVTEGSAEMLEREKLQGRAPVFAESIESAVLSRLRMLDEEEFSALPDSGEGLGRRLCRYARTEPTLDGVISAAKTKRYALSRLRRMCMCACLGIRAGDNEGTPPYIRVLAANGKGLEVLRLMSQRAKKPVITKPGDIRGLDEACQRLFELESAATDLYCLGFTAAEERRGGRDWRISPAIIK